VQFVISFRERAQKALQIQFRAAGGGELSADERKFHGGGSVLLKAAGLGSLALRFIASQTRPGNSFALAGCVFRIAGNFSMKNILIRPLSRMQASLAKRLFWRQHLAEAQAQLQRLQKELPTIEMMMSVAYLFQGKGHYRTLELKQNMVELLGLVNLLRDRRLEHVCEIGTFKGGTLYIWCQLAAPTAHIISVDLPGGQFGGGCSERCLPFFQSFRRPGQTLDCLRGNSHDDKIRAEFQKTLGGAELDFLFIDGDHSYAGVKQDFEFYSRFVKRGGLIGFHDIHHRPAQPEIEVHRFWDELKSSRRHQEFVETTDDRRKIGIGVVFND
jgi:predicted O-methyltransferase YrrM